MTQVTLETFTLTVMVLAGVVVVLALVAAWLHDEFTMLFATRGGKHRGHQR